MDRVPQEKNLRTCNVCGNARFHEELVDEIFRLDAGPVMVERIPALVCDRCGEKTFSREATEQVRLLVRDKSSASRQINMDVVVFS